MENKYIAKRFWKNSDPLMKAPLQKFSDFIDLSIGDTDFVTDERIIEAAMKDAKRGHTKYTNPQGDPELIAAIVAHYQKEYLMPLGPEQIFVSASSCLGMELVMMSILDPGDEVIVFSPYFSPYRQQIELCYGKAVEVPTFEEDGFCIREDLLRQAITSKTKALILNNPCNPTGAAYDINCCKMIASIAIEYDLLVVCDEIYTDYVYEQPFIPFRSLPGMSQKTITLNSFSKNYMMTGWRIGYIIADKTFISIIKNINENLVYSAPSISQRAAIKALELHQQMKGFYINTYKDRVYYSSEKCNEIEFLSTIRPKGTFYLFVNIQKTGLSSQQFCSKLFEEAHIGAVPGNAFGSAGEGYIRLACTVGLDKLEKAFDRIKSLTF